MKANELRIGNKLQKSNGEIFTVLRLDNTDDILVEEQRGLLTLNYNLFGIPITEEWLLKFGFEGLKKWNKKGNDNFRYIACYPNKNEVWAIDWEDYAYICISHNIKHVHQLQNLYLALTGEELIIK